MLFKQLYNWIKFKTLPPSVLFKNRLYTERDSKTRRITRNLGLTFRNSKWLNYSRTDINFNLKSNLVKSFFLFFSIILIFIWLLNFNLFYNFNLTNNDCFFLIWYLKDLIVYYFFTSFTLLTLFCSYLFEKFYTYILDRFFFKTSSNNQLNLDSLSQVPLNSYKYLYYNWLTNGVLTLENSTQLSSILLLNNFFKKDQIV
jgi:hypothetical protein